MPTVKGRHVLLPELKDPIKLQQMRPDEFEKLVKYVYDVQNADRKENQLLYYSPVSEHAKRVHLSNARYIGVGGGNGSSKTETCLAHFAMMTTGCIPEDLMEPLLPKFRGPINVRVICESLTTVLHPIILPKLQWWKWTGVGMEGSDKGHYGWIPKLCLKDASWEKAWSEKLRVLRVICRDPENWNRVMGESTWQFMSHDQDVSDFASGDFHYVLFDEPSRHAIWIENQARTMRVNGTMMLAMTWPDDPALPVDWIFDELYEPGRDGPNKSDQHEWIELHTTDNPYLNQDAIAAQMKNWSRTMVQVRIYGRPIRFSNRIHPLFTDLDATWCFNCREEIIVRDGKCMQCDSDDVTVFRHVREFDSNPSWPTIFLLDPHPRKPHMFCWAQIDPSDDIWIVAEDELSEDCGEVHRLVSEIEERYGLYVPLRLIDPNMGRSPSSQDRNRTWQDEFSDAGLFCDLADDSDVGRARINEYLKPDEHMRQPRFHIHPRCINSVSQMKRYTWDDHKRTLEKDVKQKPRTKYDDYPTLFKYLLNYHPKFAWLKDGAPIIRRGMRKGAY